MCSKHLYPLAPFAEQLETRCIATVKGSWCIDSPMKKDKKHYCHWQMKMLRMSGGQRAKTMPPRRSSHFSPTVADCWLDCQHSGWTAFSSANVQLLVRVYGERVRVVAASVGESLWCGDVRRFGRGILKGQDGITGDIRELGLQGWLGVEGHLTRIPWQH